MAALRSEGAERDEAIAQLYDVVAAGRALRARPRRAALSYVRGEELDDIATQAADDALMAVLGKLDDYRGASRFTTWAYKFALLEAGVKLRRRAWQDREVVLDAEDWPALIDHALIGTRRTGTGRDAGGATRMPWRRRSRHISGEVFVALALNEVPIDVLAERLDTTRGALYKTLHDARRKLRQELELEQVMTNSRPRQHLGPTGYEVSCEECFELLDEYVELELKGADADTRSPRDAHPPRRLPRVPRGTREPARRS